MNGGDQIRRLQSPVTQFRYYGGWRSWSWCRPNLCLVIDFFLNGMVFLAGRGRSQRTPVGIMSTGSGAGGGDGAKVRSLSTIMDVALWIVGGEERGSQGDVSSAAVCWSGMRAGGDTTSLAQGICVLWGFSGGCGWLLMLFIGCREGAFSSRSSSRENCRLACSSSPMTRRNSGPPAVTARLSSSTLQVCRC